MNNLTVISECCNTKYKLHKVFVDNQTYLYIKKNNQMKLMFNSSNEYVDLYINSIKKECGKCLNEVGEIC